jgi:site-specific recombinase XerC
VHAAGPPKKTDVARNAYAPDIIEQLREAQPTLRDQIGIQLLGRLGLRKNELRLVQIGDLDLIHGTVKVHAKGGHIHKVPIAYATLTSDIEVHIVGRPVNE